MATAEATKPDLPIEEKNRYTYEDYEKLPEGAPYELTRGELVRSPAPSLTHQRITRRIMKFIDEHVTDGEVFFAPVNVYLASETVLQPDLLFISDEQSHIKRDKGVEGAPDLVVEVISPATAHDDLTSKKRLYEDHGVKEYWIVDPDERMVEIYKNTDEGFMQHSRRVAEGRASSSLLKDLTVNLTERFKK